MCSHTTHYVQITVTYVELSQPAAIFLIKHQYQPELFDHLEQR